MAKKKITKKEKDFVRNRAKNCCEYCAYPEDYANQFYAAEHTFPTSKGGKDDVKNYALSCQPCNNHKYNKTEGIDPATGKMVSLFNPRQQKWLDHFVWSPDLILIYAITPIGRATIQTLHLNRKNLQRMRAVLLLIDEHPPKHLRLVKK